MRKIVDESIWLGEVPENVHSIGTAAIVVQVTGTNWPRPQYTLLAHGLCRFQIERVVKDSPFINAKVVKDFSYVVVVCLVEYKWIMFLYYYHHAVVDFISLHRDESTV